MVLEQVQGHFERLVETDPFRRRFIEGRGRVSRARTNLATAKKA